MGDILGSIFGTSSTQTQKTSPDAMTRALNELRVQQASNLFSLDDLWRYSGQNPNGTYSPTFETEQLLKNATEALRPVDYSNLLSLDQYRQSFDPVTQTYKDSLAQLGDTTNQAITGNQADYNAVRSNVADRIASARGTLNTDYLTGLDTAGSTYGRVSGDINADYNAAIARGDYDYARTLLRSDTDFANAMAQSESNYGRNMSTLQGDTANALGLRGLAREQALQLGIGATGNYIDQIATPRINQAMTLQGLESGGAVPAAIARATAENALPYLQAIENTYGSDVANLMANYMSQRTGIGTTTQSTQAQLGQAQAAQNAQIGQSQAQSDAALGGQLMSLQGAAGQTYQNNVNQLAQALLANGMALEEAGISAESTLGQQIIAAQNALRQQEVQGQTQLATTFMPLQAGFAQSVPTVSGQLSMLPGQMQALSTANATALAPLADFSRQLKESDLLRRQGLVTSVYTGIPFSPGGTTQQASGTGNMFDQLGGTISSGVTGGQGGFSTLGTKT